MTAYRRDLTPGEVITKFASARFFADPPPAAIQSIYGTLRLEGGRLFFGSLDPRLAAEWADDGVALIYDPDSRIARLISSRLQALGFETRPAVAPEAGR